MYILQVIFQKTGPVGDNPGGYDAGNGIQYREDE